MFVENVGSVGGKVRPALVVQSDRNNSHLRETIIAAISSNLSRANELHQLLIELSTADGTASGLLHNSVVRCERLHTVPQTDVRRVIGKLPEALMAQIDECLKSSLGIS
jgi:mRNA interferase MazF